MMSVLDDCLRRQFRIPATPQEFLALQIARKLGALSHVQEYAVLLENFSEEVIVEAFRRAATSARLSREGFLASFREVIAKAHEQQPSDPRHQS